MMRRFDYASTTAERLLGFRFPPPIPPALRAPLVALAATLTLTGSVAVLEEARFRAAERAAAELRARLTTAEVSVARARLVRSDVIRLHALATQIAQIRRSGAARASEIAALGNALPSDTWLTAVRIEPRSRAIEGRAAAVSSVARAMTALVRLPAYAGARLLSVRDDAARSGVTYAIALESAP